MASSDFDTAIRMALEPLTHQDRMVLCKHCGLVRHTDGEHVCRTEPLEFQGMERDEKRRAKSYAIE